MIYSLYIYTRNGSCLYQEKWNTSATKSMNYSDPDEERRLLFGLLFSLKEFVFKLAPTTSNGGDGFMANGGGADQLLAPQMEGMQRYQTNAYTCHQYETPSGLRFILMTDNQAGDLSAVLKHIYAHIYVEYVVNNPLSDIKSAKQITSQLFKMQLKHYIEGLPCFR
ncbi:Trafficking protein particle complex subunit, partial [Globisporangium splendens]